MSGLDAARKRAGRLYRSPGLRTVYTDGARAALAGHPETVCPYQAADGGWRLTTRQAWLRGYRSIVPVEG